MNKTELRRQAIVNALRTAKEPISGSALGKICGVSRQVVVQDIALLRGQGIPIISMHRGYVLESTTTWPKRLFKCRHTVAQTKEELLSIVDLGGRVEDVLVNHRIYGLVSSKIAVSCRRDVDRFIQDLENGNSSPLMLITNGYHFHHVSAQSEDILDDIQKTLDERGFLAPLTSYEQNLFGVCEHSDAHGSIR